MDGSWPLHPIDAIRGSDVLEIEGPEVEKLDVNSPEIEGRKIGPSETGPSEPGPSEIEPSEIEPSEIEKVETWTTERVEQLMQLWDEGVTTAEIGRRIGVTKNAVIGKVHRLGLVPRVVTHKPPPRRNVFDFVGPACMWPHGHPGEDDFHFCGAHPIAGKPYCANHAAVAYLRPKDNKSEAA